MHPGGPALDPWPTLTPPGAQHPYLIADRAGAGITPPLMVSLFSSLNPLVARLCGARTGALSTQSRDRI